MFYAMPHTPQWLIGKDMVPRYNEICYFIDNTDLAGSQLTLLDINFYGILIYFAGSGMSAQSS